MTRAHHPARVLCVGLDALDGVTSLCGVIDLGFQRHPRNRLVPMMVGVLMYNMGSLARWLDGRSRGKPAKSFLAEPGSGVTRGGVVAYAALHGPGLAALRGLRRRLRLGPADAKP